MFNVLLDRFPDNYKGYLIRTDFRIGMQIISCFKDKSVFKYEKDRICLKLLYGNSLPPKDIAIDGLIWFMNLGELPKIPDNVSEQDEEPQPSKKEKDIIDFEIDSSRIYSGFKSTFDIDLDSVKMHWFKFRALLFELRNCHLSDITELRKMSTAKLEPAQKRDIEKLKRLYAIDDKDEDTFDEKQEAQLRGLMSRT